MKLVRGVPVIDDGGFSIYKTVSKEEHTYLIPGAQKIQMRQRKITMKGLQRQF